MPSSEISERPLRASEILLNPHTEDPPWWPKPVTVEELMTFSEEEFVVRMWPAQLRGWDYSIL